MSLFILTPLPISAISDFGKIASKALKKDWKWKFFFRGFTIKQWGFGIVYRKKCKRIA